MSVSPVPSAYHSITPYLIVDGAAKALAWYTEAFGGTELLRLPGPDGRIGHAEIDIAGSRIMLADSNPDHKSPSGYGGSPVSLLLYVPDADEVIAKAKALGGTVTAAPEDKFYGDRMGSLTDPFGHTWHIATHVEDVPHDELMRRIAAMSAKS
jgi:PhnB protein